MSQYIEQYDPLVQYAGGVNTLKPVTIGSTLSVTGLATFSGGTNTTGTSVRTYSPVAVNSTATLTAAQVAAGYITSTSAASVTMTLPTGTLLGTQVNASQGTTLELFIDNTAGANTVTIAVATNGILSAAAVAGSTANFGLLTVPSGVTGIGRFTIVFSSATAYVFSRTA